MDSTRLEEVLRRVEQSLDEKDAALVRAVFESYAYVSDLVEDKNTSIRRLRQLFFGARTEKTEAVVGQKTRKPDTASPADAVAETGSAAGRRERRRIRRGGDLQGSRTQRRRGLPGCRADRRSAPVAHRGRRVSRLRSGHRLREGPGRAGADHRAAAAGGDGLPAAEAALPSVRPGLHRGRARRGRRERSTTPRPAA